MQILTFFFFARTIYRYKIRRRSPSLAVFRRARARARLRSNKPGVGPGWYYDRSKCPKSKCRRFVTTRRDDNVFTTSFSTQIKVAPVVHITYAVAVVPGRISEEIILNTVLRQFLWTTRIFVRRGDGTSAADTACNAVIDRVPRTFSRFLFARRTGRRATCTSRTSRAGSFLKAAFRPVRRRRKKPHRSPSTMSHSTYTIISGKNYKNKTKPDGCDAARARGGVR